MRQWVVRPGLTIADLVQDVANEEVAHTERRVAPTILLANSVQLGGSAAARRMHELTIVAIGEYVASELRAVLKRD